MSSFVFYKFKSQREPSRISFDGTSISVWDLKKEIILTNKMGKGIDFDFALYNPDTEEEYSNDHALIPRSTSVLARRLPPARPGRGNAAQYVADVVADSGPGPVGTGTQAALPNQYQQKGNYIRRHDRDEVDVPQPQQPRDIVAPAGAGGDEASALAAMFAASNEQWQQTQTQMSNAQFIPFKGGMRRPPGAEFQRRAFEPSKPTPPGYICYRCGQKGHWIQDCPTNSDRDFDNRPKLKRTTGIPKSFLTTVEAPQNGEGGETTNSQGLMVTTEGDFVVARPDAASWNAHRAITKNLSASDVQNLAPTDPDLTCPICSRLLRDATSTPCCGSSFCADCLKNHLTDNDQLCPECETRIKSLDRLLPDEGRRERAKRYIDDMVEASKEQELEGDLKIEEGEEADGEVKNEPEEPEAGEIHGDEARTSIAKRKKKQEPAQYRPPPMTATQLETIQQQYTFPLLQQLLMHTQMAMSNPSLAADVRQKLQPQFQQAQMLMMQYQRQAMMQQYQYQQQQMQRQQQQQQQMPGYPGGNGPPSRMARPPPGVAAPTGPRMRSASGTPQPGTDASAGAKRGRVDDGFSPQAKRMAY